MTAEHMLENYLAKHPDYWDFENEMEEVVRLKALCNEEAEQLQMLTQQDNFQHQSFQYPVYA